ncbi:MAG: FapA family protein [Bacillota bacterium]
MKDEKELQNLIKEVLQEVLGETAPKPALALPSSSPPPPPESEDGLVWVSDGHIYVRNPKGLGRFATITPGPGIQLILNNTVTTGTVIVREEDEVHAETVEEEIQGIVKVTVSPNRLTAYLWVELPGIRRCRMPDRGPSTDLVLQTEAEVIKQPVLDEAAVEKELTQKGVVFGIKGEVLKDLLQRPRDGKFIIAEGEPPDPPTDETVEITFPLEPDLRPKINPDGSVDFLEINRFPSVDPGIVLAVKNPGSPGKPGRGVNGQPIPPPKQRGCELRAGKGADLLENGTKVVAVRSGRPVLKQTGNVYTLSVDTQLVYNGDVGVSTGNIRFKGSVRIKGSITEGMKVQAAGRAEVTGMVTQATASALEDISVYGNVIGSTLNAGCGTACSQKYGPLLGTFATEIMELLNTANKLSEHPAFKEHTIRPGHLLLLLIEQKFQKIPRSIQEMQKIKKCLAENGVELPPEMIELIDRLIHFFSGLNIIKLGNLNELAKIIREILFLRQELTSLGRQKSHLIIPYAMNSKLIATGNVFVTGQGCYNTYIQAGGKVVVAGVFRGGEIITQGDVTIREAGSSRGILTKIRTAASATVRLGRAHEGVIIQVGKCRTIIKNPQAQVRVALG